MKKLISLLLAVSLALAALSLCSCGAAPEEETALPTVDEVTGSIDGNVYSSEYTGLKFTVSGDWRFLSEDEIAEITGATQEVLDEAGNNTDVSSQVYAMVAMDDATANNVNVLIQVVPDTSDVDFDQVLDDSEAQILEMGASIGASYTFSEHSTATLSGIEFQKITAHADFNGITFDQGCYIAIVDNSVINATITSYDGTPLETIEAMFN